MKRFYIGPQQIVILFIKFTLNKTIIKFLISANEKISTLLIKMGLNVNSVSKKELTPLHIACSNRKFITNRR